MGLFGTKNIAGVDIDQYEIRVVELSGNPAAARLVNLGRKPLPADAVKDGRINDVEAVGNTLLHLWTETGIRSREAILGVSNQDVLVRFAMLPSVPADKLDSMIRYQAQDYLPIPVEEAEMDYMVVGGNGQGDGQIKVLLVAARKNMIGDFMDAFETAGIKVRDIDYSTLAIARLIPASSNGETLLVANIGYEQTNLLLLSSSVPQLARSLATGQAFRDDPEGEAKRTEWAVRGHLQPDDAAKLPEMLAGEIRTSIGYFQSQSRELAVQKLLLCGSGSRLAGMRESLAEAMGLNTEIIEPFRNVDTSRSRNNCPAGARSDFSIGLSLALRGLEG